MKPEFAWIDTDIAGEIVDCAPEALALVGYSATRVRGRSLLIMFIADRPQFTELRDVLNGRFVCREAVIRPRDQHAIPVRFAIELAPHSSDSRPVLRWTFERIEKMPQMVLWRLNDWRCEFWIEARRGTLRLYCATRCVRKWHGTGDEAYRQAMTWETAVSAHPDRDPE